MKHIPLTYNESKLKYMVQQDRFLEILKKHSFQDFIDWN